jgi:hypothetical protein
MKYTADSIILNTTISRTSGVGEVLRNFAYSIKVGISLSRARISRT